VATNITKKTTAQILEALAECSHTGFQLFARFRVRARKTAKEIRTQDLELVRAWSHEDSCMESRVVVQPGTIVFRDRNGAKWRSEKECGAHKAHGKRMLRKRAADESKTFSTQLDHEVLDSAYELGTREQNQANRGLGRAIENLRLDPELDSKDWKKILKALIDIPYVVHTHARKPHVLKKAFEVALEKAQGKECPYASAKARAQGEALRERSKATDGVRPHTNEGRFARICGYSRLSIMPGESCFLVGRSNCFFNVGCKRAYSREHERRAALRKRRRDASHSDFGYATNFEWTSSTSDDPVYVTAYVNSLICTVERKILELMATCPSEEHYTTRVGFWLQKA
jgi:hypothetical protein